MIDEYHKLKKDLADCQTERDRLQAQLEESFKGVLSIRCSKHFAVPQQNKNEHGGGECGACISEERDKLLDQIAQLSADVVRLDWIEENCEGRVRGTDVPTWTVTGRDTFEPQTLRESIDREMKRTGAIA